MLRHLWLSKLKNAGGEYACTVMDTVFASDTRPLESVTVAVNVMVPGVFRNPVVKLAAVLV